MKGRLIEINSGVSRLMMARRLARRLPPSWSWWSALCQTLHQREELIKLGWVVTEEGGGLTHISGRLGGGLPAVGLLEACQRAGMARLLQQTSWQRRSTCVGCCSACASAPTAQISPQRRRILKSCGGAELTCWCVCTRTCTRTLTQILTLLKEMSALREYS